MNERCRQHSLAFLVDVVTKIRSVFFLVILVLIRWHDVYAWLTLLGLSVILLIWSGLGYFFHTYQLLPDMLVVSSGIINKHETSIPYGQIQTIKQQQWFFYKPFHVVRLAIETASGHTEQAEAILIVPENVLRELNLRRKTDTKTQPLQRLYEVSSRQILLFSLTNLSVFAGVVAFAAMVEQFLPESWYDQIWNLGNELVRAGWLVVTGVLVSLVVVSILLALIKNYLLYYAFQVKRQENQLIIESGLLQRKIQTIPLAKIQGITIQQAWLRKIFGLVSVEVLLMGGYEEETTTKLFLLPIVYEKDVYHILDFLLPEWQLNAPVLQYPSRHYWWYFIRIPLVLTVLGMVGSYFLFPWGSVIVGGVGLILMSIFWHASYFQGYDLQTSTRICVQNYFLLTRVQTFIERSKIQSFSEKTTKWLYPKKIGHVVFSFKAGIAQSSVQLNFMHQNGIQQLKKFYQNK
ncbi:PH domain-containing protein [Enterococcus saccharolyticus]|uniref:PH domain-containing protein n=1 Tax=Enterococcus saccharolyticus TaxID=41997 RepID=UPI001E2FB3F0|nr:PH domain-containing protein [Enterococcus saccharolyticus]MCD5002185.1 PH domain-containing protein [Enterococcus saccharolyticus]